MVVENGKEVAFDYTLTVEGEKVDSSQGRAPLSYTHGVGQIIPGLSRQMEGMKTGEAKTIVVAPEEGYGLVNAQAFKEIPRTALPEGLEPKVGMLLQMVGPDGRAIPVRIVEVKEGVVKIDLNHPLAGKTLTFDVKVVSVQQKK